MKLLLTDRVWGGQEGALATGVLLRPHWCLSDPVEGHWVVAASLAPGEAV